MKPIDPPTSYGPHVRIRATFGPVAPFTDLVVEVRDKILGWREVARFNDESPSAMADVDIAARGARRSLLEYENILHINDYRRL